jgi:CheY-like chemotaxis protein
MDKIFEAFVQGEKGGMQVQQGAGLGLAIVLRLTGLMGGEISVESVPGAGTVFVFSLPFALVPEPVGAHNFASDQDFCTLASWHILVAEDDPVSALYLETLLKRCGHEVVVVHDGRQAVDMLAERGFDLVFMDVQMPVMDGLEAVRIIRSRGGPAATIPIVALTAYAMAGDRECFLAAGMNDHIPKPVHMDAVSRVMDRLLADKAMA